MAAQKPDKVYTKLEQILIYECNIIVKICLVL